MALCSGTPFSSWSHAAVLVVHFPTLADLADSVASRYAGVRTKPKCHMGGQPVLVLVYNDPKQRTRLVL